MIPIRTLIASWLLVMAGIVCFAQVPMTGAGKGAPGGGGGGSMVTVDQVGAEVANSGPNIGYTSCTISGGLTDSALIAVLVNSNGTSSSAPVATWDVSGTPQTMTLLKNQDAGGGIQVVIWGLRNPHSGNLQLAFTSINAASSVFVVAMSFSNVQQSSDAAAFAHVAGASGTTTGASSVAVTSQAGDIVVAGHSIASPANVTAASGTTVFIDNTGAVSDGVVNYDNGSSSVSMSATIASSTGWVAAGIDIVHD